MEIKLNKKDNIKNISSRECFEKLSIEVNSQLIDVRTKPEWIYVGVPDLSSINKKVIFVSWQVYPEMGTNKFFENQILESNIKKDNNLYFICRSGNRSNNAAEFLASRGFSNCFNVIDGFEGKLNHERQRTLIDGWQFNNLPWKQ
jgi:rhodanese-related sulfurtransferase